MKHMGCYFDVFWTLIIGRVKLRKLHKLSLVFFLKRQWIKKLTVLYFTIRRELYLPHLVLHMIIHSPVPDHVPKAY